MSKKTDLSQILHCPCRPLFEYKTYTTFKIHKKSQRHLFFEQKKEILDLRIRLGKDFQQSWGALKYKNKQLKYKLKQICKKKTLSAKLRTRKQSNKAIKTKRKIKKQQRIELEKQMIGLAM